ncbi:stage II sporulation protein M [Marinibactrum halimedae]|uniref:Membrane protein n=1 Tax=Marinibactrum halimedae TaxID=1444977 RepID=A0AA37T9R3_9GAMM|nr:stage II sporulation protein M [Marinibactrum halimedae]MCD9460982.1 stage II sporulation protein M [Marinibactrum halimedae]GLS28074.1 membrane protein [Marinibactrum halimedae]
MKQQEFETKYQDTWHTFEAMIDHYHTNNITPGKEFPTLYRQICGHLSLVRERHYASSIEIYLNRLITQGHHILYEHSGKIRWHDILKAIALFPAALQRNGFYVLWATLLFVVPGLFTAFFTYADTSFIYSIIEPNTVQDIEFMYDPKNNKLGRENRGSDTDIAMFGIYIYNNIGIAFRTFAGGILFGLGAAFFLVFNGLYLGAVASRLTMAGFSSTFYPFVIGHGAFELTAIVFSGAAGLKIGHALINPRQYTRLTALKLAARDAVHIMYGATLMLFVAAFLEAFWSSSSTLPIAVKLSVGVLFWALVIWFCFYSRLGYRNEL